MLEQSPTTPKAKTKEHMLNIPAIARTKIYLFPI